MKVVEISKRIIDIGGACVLDNVVFEESATYSYFSGEYNSGVNYKAYRYGADNIRTQNSGVIANKPTTLAEFEALVYT